MIRAMESQGGTPPEVMSLRSVRPMTQLLDEEAQGVTRLRLTVHDERRPPVIVFDGELDGETYGKAAEEVLGHLNAGASRSWVFDMERLSFIDSSGLRMLIQAYKALVDGERITLVAPSPMLRRVLSITGCDALFDLDLRGRAERVPEVEVQPARINPKLAT